MDFRCPICKKTIPSTTTAPSGRQQINAPFFPFCSKRCRMIDLGAWLEERYRVGVDSMTAYDDQDGPSASHSDTDTH